MSGVKQLLDTEGLQTPKTVKSPKRDRDEADLGAFGSFGSDDPDNRNPGDIEPFPVEALPSILREMVKETSRVTQTPDSLCAVVALGILSASYGGGLLVQSGAGRITSPNLYLLGIARSGTGKGRVFSIIAKPFLNSEREAVLQ
jgi:hypothetical protein